jgi:hypothetical protein
MSLAGTGGAATLTGAAARNRRPRSITVLRDNPMVRPIAAQVAPCARIAQIAPSAASLHRLATGMSPSRFPTSG